MMIQDKIDEVVMAVAKALNECPIPDGDREYILNGVKEIGFKWQEANAHGRAACILMGLIGDHYNPDLCRRFVKECVELKQFDELQTKESSGSAFCLKMIPMPYYAALIDLLMVQAIEDDAGEYQEKSEGKEPEESPQKKTDAKRATVEVADKLPKAAKAPAKKTTASGKATRKKASGAADGK